MVRTVFGLTDDIAKEVIYVSLGSMSIIRVFELGYDKYDFNGT